MARVGGPLSFFLFVLAPPSCLCLGAGVGTFKGRPHRERYSIVLATPPAYSRRRELLHVCSM